jgi:hypothetical protein
MIAALDPLGKLDLLRGGQERDLADVLQEELERIGRDLGLFRLGRGGQLVLVDVGVDDGDLGFVERRVELVELARVELELVQRERDFVRVESAALEACLEEALGFVSREYVRDRGSFRCSLRFACGGQRIPLPRQRVTR